MCIVYKHNFLCTGNSKIHLTSLLWYLLYCSDLQQNHSISEVCLYKGNSK